MNDNFESEQDWRYERKFLLERGDYRVLEQTILGNRMFFSKLHAERQINNVYFDTEGFNCFVQNIDGQVERRKLRLRWYGETFGHISNPVLEIKIKHSLVGRKKRYKLKAFDFSKSCDRQVLAECFANSDLPETVAETLRTMPPVLLNSYRRRYYISADRRYRLTLDYDLAFYKMAAGKNSAFSKRSTSSLIVEIKYDADNDDDIELISNDFPFRMTKSSKYVQGIGVTLMNL